MNRATKFWASNLLALLLTHVLSAAETNLPTRALSSYPYQTSTLTNDAFVMLRAGSNVNLIRYQSLAAEIRNGYVSSNALPWILEPFVLVDNMYSYVGAAQSNAQLTAYTVGTNATNYSFAGLATLGTNATNYAAALAANGTNHAAALAANGSNNTANAIAPLPTVATVSNMFANVGFPVTTSGAPSVVIGPGMSSGSTNASFRFTGNDYSGFALFYVTNSTSPSRIFTVTFSRTMPTNFDVVISPCSTTAAKYSARVYVQLTNNGWSLFTGQDQLPAEGPYAWSYQVNFNQSGGTKQFVDLSDPKAAVKLSQKVASAAVVTTVENGLSLLTVSGAGSPQLNGTYQWDGSYYFTNIAVNAFIARSESNWRMVYLGDEYYRSYDLGVTNDPWSPTFSGVGPGPTVRDYVFQPANAAALNASALTSGTVPDARLSTNVTRGAWTLSSGIVTNGSAGFTVPGSSNAVMLAVPLDSQDYALTSWDGTQWNVSPQGGIANVWRWLLFAPQ